MKFVDRIEESQRLKKVLNADKSTFTVIYGRRRLGKSTLMTKMLGNEDVYYLARQRYSFSPDEKPSSDGCLDEY
jgi:AAA+ ATPase superfamily predicted ATPase